MLRGYDTLIVAEVDTTISERLLSALVMGWDLLPVAAQGRLIRDTCLINGDRGL